MGILPDRLVDMTVRDLSAYAKGRQVADKRDWARVISGAWHTAYWTAYAPQKAKDFEKLERVLKRISGSESASARDPEAWKKEHDAVMAWVRSQNQ